MADIRGRRLRYQVWFHKAAPKFAISNLIKIDRLIFPARAEGEVSPNLIFFQNNVSIPHLGYGPAHRHGEVSVDV